MKLGLAWVVSWGLLVTAPMGCDEAQPVIIQVGGPAPTTTYPPGTGGGSAGPCTTPPAPPPGYVGFMTCQVTQAMAAQAYSDWKIRHVVSCPNGSLQVLKATNETVSEGIGYGMLLSVAHNDRASFDGFYRFYTTNSVNGLMQWDNKNGCTPVTSGGAASDADLDVAMALIQADKRWGGYTAAWSALLTAIRTREVMLASGTIPSLLKPGDAWGGPACLNPSYFAPGYYRVFAQKEPSQGALWSQLAADSYLVLNRASNGNTGLVPNWTDTNGTPGGSGSCGGEPTIYGYDAARTPWRIAVDYVWWNNADAKNWLGRIINWVAATGIQNIGDKYALDGTKQGSVHNSMTVGAFMDGAMAHSQAALDTFAVEFVKLYETSYFPESLRALYFLLATGMFDRGL